MLTINPSYPTLDDLLAKRLFRIPHYQRAYSWETTHRKDMFSDIEKLRFDRDSFHFMSTVVGLRHDDSIEIATDRYTMIDIVDGQQRLTTLVILLKSIEQDLSTQGDEQQAQELRDLLVKRDRTSVILLQTNHDTSNFFSDFLRNGTCPPIERAQTLADRELLTAIVECKSFVEKWADSIQLLGVIKNQLKFLFHEIDDEAAVYTVFEVLNNRGLYVSWLDRLKSMLMKVAFEDNQGNNDEHTNELHQIWGRIYEAIGLRQGLSTESLRFAATLTSRVQISKTLSERQAVHGLLEQSEGNVSEAIAVSNWVMEVTSAVNRFLEDMRHSREAVTKISHARLLAVAIMLREFDADQERCLLDQWEKTTYRIFGLCRKDARTGVGSFVRLARDAHDRPLSANEISRRIQQISEGEDHDIESALRQIQNSNCYEGWEDELRYLLFRYEENLTHQHGQTYSNEQWERIWQESAAKSIEHILPQSTVQQEHSEHQEDVSVHRLGNLLLLPPNLNSQLSNLDPEEKAEHYVRTGFHSAVEVADSIRQHGWGIEQIEERENKLLDWIRHEWTDEGGRNTIQGDE